jgi:hypothetical protein
MDLNQKQENENHSPKTRTFPTRMHYITPFFLKKKRKQNWGGSILTGHVMIEMADTRATHHLINYMSNLNIQMNDFFLVMIKFAFKMIQVWKSLI